MVASENMLLACLVPVGLLHLAAECLRGGDSDDECPSTPRPAMEYLPWRASMEIYAELEEKEGERFELNELFCTIERETAQMRSERDAAVAHDPPHEWQRAQAAECCGTAAWRHVDNDDDEVGRCT